VEACIEARDVVKVYPGGKAAVHGVSLRVGCGELVALLGPNGSGKSTLLAMVSGVVKPNRGNVRILDHDLWGHDGITTRRLVGYVAQHDGFYPQLTGWENLALYASMRGVSVDRGLVKELADELGLDMRDLSRRVGSYSGGMKRKLSIIAALLHGPRVLVLDEPDSGLDPGSRRRLLHLLRSVAAKGVGVLYATHIGSSGEEADRVIFMHSGRVVDEDSPSRLVERYASSIIIEVSVKSIEDLVQQLKDVPGTVYARVADGKIRIGLRGNGEAVASIARLASRYGLEWMEIRRPDLEDAFLAATGAALGTGER